MSCKNDDFSFILQNLQIELKNKKGSSNEKFFRPFKGLFCLRNNRKVKCSRFIVLREIFTKNLCSVAKKKKQVHILKDFLPTWFFFLSFKMPFLWELLQSRSVKIILGISLETEEFMELFKMKFHYFSCLFVNLKLEHRQ